MPKKEEILEAVKSCLEDKGKKKFMQTVELAVNFRGVDFSKSENRLNIDVLLPKGRGKEKKIIVFADGPLAKQAKEAGADKIVPGTDIEKFPKNEVKKMAKDWEFLAQPQLMMQVGKNFGQILGGRGKLPRPLVGNVAAMVKSLRNTVKIRVRGKNLPTVHCPVGTEKMSVEDITENILAVFSAITSKLPEHAITSVYVKLSMGKPQKVGGKGKASEEEKETSEVSESPASE